MKNCKLLIGGRPMPLSDDILNQIRFVFRVEDFLNPRSVSGSFAKRAIRVTATKEAIDFFNHLGCDQGILKRGFTYDARIEIDGIDIFSGVAFIRQVSRVARGNSKGAGEYSIELYGSNAMWFSSLKKMKIADIDFGEYEADNATIEAKTNATYAAGNDIGYTLIKYGTWLNPDYVLFQEHTQFIFIKSILRESFRLAGYKISSTFFDTPFFERLILPVPQQVENTGVFARYQTIESFSIPANSSVKVFQPFEIVDDLNAYDPDASIYQNPYPGFFEFTTDFPSIDGVVCVYYPNGSPTFFEAVPGQAVTFTPSTAGSTFEVYLKNENDFEIFISFVETGVRAIKAGSSVVVKQKVPGDWLVLDLLLDLALIFNLSFETDELAKTIAVEPRDDYRIPGDYSAVNPGFFSAENQQNFTRKLDLSKEGVLTTPDGDYSSVQLKYKDGDDPTLETLEKNLPEPLFSAKYTFGDYREENARLLETKFFVRTCHIFDSSIRHDSSEKIPQLPLIYPDANYSEDQTKPANYQILPRLLYFAGRRDGQDGYINLGAAKAPYDPPVAFMVNYNDQNNTDPNLSFAAEKTIGGGFTPGILQIFHLQNFVRMESSFSLEDFFFLSATDIFKLSFRDKIYINGTRYLLGEVSNYDPTANTSTKAVLVTDEHATEEDVAKISIPRIRGVVYEP